MIEYITEDYYSYMLDNNIMPETGVEYIILSSSKND